MLAASIVGTTSCNRNSEWKVVDGQKEDQPPLGNFDGIPNDTSLIGKSFSLELDDEQGNVKEVQITLRRPELSQIQLTVDGKTFILENGDLKKIIDVKTRKKRGIVIVGENDDENLKILMPTVEALVETDELKKAVSGLRYPKKEPVKNNDAKPDDAQKEKTPSVSVMAELPFVGKQKIDFAVKEMK